MKIEMAIFIKKKWLLLIILIMRRFSSSRYGAIGYMYKQSSNRGNDANIQASDTHSHAPIYPRKIFDKLHSKFAKAEDPKGIFNRDSEAVNDSPQCSPLTSTILNWH